MSLSTAQDYDELKSALLRRYYMTEDGFMREFKSNRHAPGQTFTQFTVGFGSHLTRWIERTEIKNKKHWVDFLC